MQKHLVKRSVLMYYSKIKIISFLAIFTIFASSTLLSKNTCPCCLEKQKAAQEAAKALCCCGSHVNQKVSHQSHQNNKFCGCKEDCNCKVLCKAKKSNKDATIIIKEKISFDWQKIIVNVSEARFIIQKCLLSPIYDLNKVKMKISFIPEYIPLRI